MSLNLLINRLEEWTPPPAFESRVVRAAEMALLVNGPRDGDVSFTFVSGTEIRELNRDYLGNDRATDVIAFELGDGGLLIGDVYICPEVAAENASDTDEDLPTELLRLVIHGALHVIGYAHPEGPERADAPMYVIQEELLHTLAHD